jgi:hypothetical protein
MLRKQNLVQVGNNPDKRRNKTENINTTNNKSTSILRSFLPHRRERLNENGSMNSELTIPTDKDTSLSDVTDDVIAMPNISVERAIASTEKMSTANDLQAIKYISRSVPSEQLSRFYTVPDNIRTLEDGGCLFSFTCNHWLTPYEGEMVDSMINLSGFDDEEKENFVPKFSYAEYSQDQNASGRQSRTSLHGYTNSSTHSSSTCGSGQRSLHGPSYTFLLARCGYLLTGVDFAQLMSNPSLLATLDYQRSCQPEGTRIWDDYDKMDRDNFRITKPIIPYIYSFTIQFRVSRVEDPDEIQQLSNHLHIPVDGAIVLERTKRSIPPKEDATKKTKSVLVYTNLGQGVVLVSHLTVLIQSGLPEVVERILGTVGQWGLGETAETAWRTRRYLQERMPYGPTEPTFFLDASSEIPADETKPDIAKGDHEGNEDEDDEDDFFDAVDLPTTDVLVH